MLKPPYKDPHNRWLTASLFYEPSYTVVKAERFCHPVFTLLEERPGYICFRKTFVALNDPTGYKWAMEYLGDWQHWLKLLKSKWFKEAYDHTVRELYTKLRSEGLNVIKQIATDGDMKSAGAAAKYLAELENNLNKRTAGRPSKEMVDGELKNAAKLLEVEDEDAERIGLTVIAGGKIG